MQRFYLTLLVVAMTATVGVTMQYNCKLMEGTPAQCIHDAPWTLTKSGLHIRNKIKNINKIKINIKML